MDVKKRFKWEELIFLIRRTSVRTTFPLDRLFLKLQLSVESAFSFQLYNNKYGIEEFSARQFVLCLMPAACRHGTINVFQIIKRNVCR